MIYIRGDTHGDLDYFTDEKMPGQSRWTEADTLIIAGDFGFVFHGGDADPQERAKLDELARKPYTILFVDGNHEGFPYLEAYPQEERYGAPVNRIRDNIFWLRRGYVYVIENLSFFVMGGAHSMDKAFRLCLEEYSGRPFWFPEELPTPAEYRRAGETLKKRNMQVDYIVTHTAPENVIMRLLRQMPDPHDRELTGFLEWAYHMVSYKKWFFGHFHEDKEVVPGVIACLDVLHALPES